MKYRVLHVSHLASLAGAEQALLRLTAGMDREQFTSLVVLPSDGPLRDALTKADVHTCISPIRWWIPATHWGSAEFVAQMDGLEQRWRALARLAERERVDLVHTNTLVTVEGALAAAALGIPHVWHSRGLFDEQPGNSFPPSYVHDLSFFYSTIDRLGDHVICVSKAVQDQAARYLRSTSSTTIADGFDPRRAEASGRAGFLAEFGLPADARAIACVGGVQRRKGQLDLIGAFASVTKEYPEAVLLLCGETGDAEYVESVRSRIRCLGLISNVKFLGFRSDVARIVHHCELVAQPAHSEGFGLAILESMAAGKPVIATRSGGPEDIIGDGISGILVTPGAPEELASAISLLLGNADLAQKIGTAARRRAMLFTVPAASRKIENLWKKMMVTSKTAQPILTETVCAQIEARFRSL
jgi:glycosyltransferase involved in cell wall biosynthesis